MFGVVFIYAKMFHMEKEIIIFTDGGAIGNPGPGGWGAIVFDQEKNTVSEIAGKEEKTTNNRMEMTAAINALSGVSDISPITIYSDSKYVITGITNWIFSWQQSGWKTKNKTDVLNKDLWQKLAEVSKDKNIEWKYVEGHSGNPGNERVDEIANSFARGKQIPLFVGKKTDYKINLLSGAKNPEGKNKIQKQKSKAYSYLSLVDGKIEKHKTWAECEKCVYGKKAKFKKTFSKEDEEEIIKEWLS